jgi:hypothetical protein
VSTPETGHKKQPIGIAAFDTLRAEDEDWLLACFIPPNDFELMAGNRSIVVFGESGSGKTALRRALVQRLQYKGKPTHLIVEWRPMPLEQGASSDLSIVRHHLNQIFDLGALALINHLVQYPNDWDTIPAWARTTIAWFVRTFIQGDPNTRLSEWLETESPTVARILQMLLNHRGEVLSATASPNYIAAELIKALKPMGLTGIWVVMDGLEAWAEAEPERLSTELVNFLSALTLFEQTNVVYKLFLPQRLQAALSTASGLIRRRLDSYHLQWDVSSLRMLVERRLALATGIEGFTLSHLCQDPPAARTEKDKKEKRRLSLFEWLCATGGTNPREWLDQVRPLVQHYLTNHLTQAIDWETWRQLRLEHPPRLYFDASRNLVIVGGRQVPLEQVPAKAYAMLRYLVEHGNQVVSKSELYFRGYQGFDRTPRQGEKGFQEPAEYEGLIDTNLYRLRQALEPEPFDPVLLVTVKGHGVQLKLRW